MSCWPLIDSPLCAKEQACLHYRLTKGRISMNIEEQEQFLKFLVETKKVLPPTAIQTCLTVQHALTELGIEKTIDKVIIEKGFLDAKQITVLLREFRGGDEEMIPGYRIIRKLGEGAMGEVYSAIDLNKDNCPVAIKILFPHLGKRKATAQRFLQEAKLCIHKLNHSNIVKGYEVGYEATHDFFFYVMEFVDGKNLRALLKDHGVFSEPLAIKIMMQMCSALQHAASFNLVHRDIKPDNIMLTKTGESKLCDLGLARDWTQDDLGLTKTGAVMGTPFYISPEAADGQKLDTRSDIYSLGATIYHMVVGTVPFDGPNTAVVLNRHRNDPLIPPKELRDQLSTGFSSIIEMMMEKSPNARYQNAGEILEDLRRLQNGYAPNALIRNMQSYGVTEPLRKPKTPTISTDIETETETVANAEVAMEAQPIEAAVEAEAEQPAASPTPDTPMMTARRNVNPISDIPTHAIHPTPTLKRPHTANPTATPNTKQQGMLQDTNEISKFVESTTTNIKRRQDMVEEYLIEDPNAPNFDSVILVDHRKRQKPSHFFPTFLNSTEQRILSKAGLQTKFKLLALGGLIAVVVLIILIALLKLLSII